MKKHTMTVEAACQLLYEAGKETKYEGGLVENAPKLFETMLAYADPAYIEAAEVLDGEGDNLALDQFTEGLR